MVIGHHVSLNQHQQRMSPQLPERLRGTTATLGALSLLTTALRCYVRMKVLKKWGWDDSFIFAAFVCQPLKLSISSHRI